MNITWIILTSIAILSLIVFFGGRRNAVWGGLTLGAFGGLVGVWFVYMFRDEGFQWVIVGKCMVFFVLIGLGIELRAKIENRAKKRTNSVRHNKLLK